MTALDGRSSSSAVRGRRSWPYRIHVGLARTVARVAAYLFIGARECGGAHFYIVPLWNETHTDLRVRDLRSEPPAGHPERLVPQAALDPTEVRIWADLDTIWYDAG
jgi:hypothetical protein